MRWAKLSNPNPGDTREIRRFLWLPLNLEDETRWLEYAVIVQKYGTYYGPISGVPMGYWKDTWWKK